jgi:hypothetical protein
MNPEQPDLTPETGTEQPQVEAQIPEEQNDQAPADQQTSAIDPEDDPERIEYWKKKATTQGQENIVVTKKLEDATRPKELTNEPTDSELQAAFPEWDVMTDTEKRLARETSRATRIASQLQQERQEEKAKAAWNTDLELTIAQNPSLQGKEQAFKDFANKPTRRGVDLETLRKAFLFDSSTSAPKPKPTLKPGLLPGNGGPRDPEKPKTLSGEELKTLRQTDSAGYREYVKTHPMTEV